MSITIGSNLLLGVEKSTILYVFLAPSRKYLKREYFVCLQSKIILHHYPDILEK